MIEKTLKFLTELTSHAREQLFIKGILTNICAICGKERLRTELKMQVDHINGNKYDNRLINLRAICPDCHSKTETFGGRNKGRMHRFPDDVKLLVKIDGEWKAIYIIEIKSDYKFQELAIKSRKTSK